MTHLYLIRHGQHIGAVKNIIGDTELSLLGIKQAERLRDRLAATGEIKADVLISSTFKRAKQTAEIIAPALGLPIIFDDEVQEWRDGEAEGMTMEEYRETFGEVDVEEHPFQPVAPGGESWGQFFLRVGTALDRITHQYEGKTIVIVCHGGVVDSSFLYFFGIGALQMPRISFDTRNTSITHWHQHTNEIFSPHPRWHLEKYNDYMHLRDMNSPVPIPWEELSGPTIGADLPAVPLETEDDRTR